MSMNVFSHHLFEYRKGLRNLILHTTLAANRAPIETRLAKHGVDYVVYPLSNGRINVFFGAAECVETVRRIGKASLNDYTPEEDFLLGIMLGYDRLAQCRRYLVRREGHARPKLPEGRQPGVWRESAPVRAVRAGFTLIALLIVLGILAALASLLLMRTALPGGQQSGVCLPACRCPCLETEEPFFGKCKTFLAAVSGMGCLTR